MSRSELAVIEQLDTRYAEVLCKSVGKRLLGDVEWDRFVGAIGLGKGISLAGEKDGANPEHKHGSRMPKGTK
ncbi:hypothetical protein [Hephaestia caeni]|uniref:hypothetical protein n=1 Tax=Hephaestia caeni TaxID=645617 RepID=UPI001FE24A68|nr:hypothetical protein [Hephaestia caeni]